MGILDKLFGKRKQRQEKETEVEESIQHERLSLADLNLSIDIPEISPEGFYFISKGDLQFYGGKPSYEFIIRSFSEPYGLLSIECRVQEKRLTDSELLEQINQNRDDLKHYEEEGSWKTIESEYILFCGHPTHRYVYEEIGRDEINYCWCIATRDIVYGMYVPVFVGHSGEERKRHLHNIEGVKKMVKTMKISGESMDISEEELRETMKIINKEKDEKDTAAEFDEFQFLCPLCGHEFNNIKFYKILALGSRTLVCGGCGNKVHAVKHSNGKLTVSMETLPIGETAETHEYEPIEKKGN